MGAGKKSSLLVLKNVEGNITTNNMRQVMAKIPGIHIWENDGSGPYSKHNPESANWDQPG